MPNEHRPLKVFLCHASQDKPVVRELSRRLIGEGWIDTWLDENKLLPGQDWRLGIEEAVETSDVVIICLSENSVSKEGHVQKELRYAREIALEKPDETIFLIPLRLDDCDVPRGLRFYQWVDYFGKNRDEAYRALTRSLKVRHEQKLRFEEAELARQGKERLEYDAVEKVKQEITNETKSGEEKLVRKTSQVKLETTKHQSVQRSPNRSSISMIIAIGGITVAIVISILNSLNKPTVLIPPSFHASSPTITSTSEVIASPTKSFTPTPTITSTNTTVPTSTDLPTEIADAKGVKMELVSENGGGPFYMDKYEVTNALYKLCVDLNVCQLPKNLVHYNQPSYSDHPVVYVNKAMATSFCEWRDARLPTGNEWQKASANDLANYPHDCNFGNFGSGLINHHYLYVTKREVIYCVGTTVPVGSYKLAKNKFNIYDLIGNVAEWVSDGSSFYRVEGGAWDDYNILPKNLKSDVASNTIGFRCARDVNP